MIDAFGRKIEILRISVTDRCNYRCMYCMPASGVPDIPHTKIMRYEEIVAVARAAIELGITRFRLTGGEPLVRIGITDLVRQLAALPGIEELAMTTNGSLLAPVAADLKAAGLERVNISLDTLDPLKFHQITRGGRLEDVLRGIDAAVAAGLTPVKLNIVVMDGNDTRDAEMVEAFARQKGLISRRISKIDLKSGVFDVVEHSDRGNCRRCNRLRMTSDGYIRCCLLHDKMFDVRTHGPKEALILAAKAKPEYGVGTCVENMNRIGG